MAITLISIIRMREFKADHLLVAPFFQVAVALTQPVIIFCAASWRLAIEETLAALAETGTWETVDLPLGVNLVTTKWVFKLKLVTDSQIDKYKARLVARGFTQQEGVDFFEVFSGVIRLETLRALLAIAAIMDSEVHQMDFTAAYTQGYLGEDIYLGQVKGVTIPKGKVLKLRRSLEGLRQSGRTWNKYVSKAFREYGLQSIAADSYAYASRDKELIVAIHVEDWLITSKDKNKITNLKKFLTKYFNIKDMGEISAIIDIRVTRNRAEKVIELDQQHYIETLAESYGIDAADVARVWTPATGKESLAPRDTSIQEPDGDIVGNCEERCEHILLNVRCSSE